MTLCAPELLRPDHLTSDFSCGERVLDEWFRRRALANQVSGGSRTFVSCEGDQVVGYYAIAAGSVARVDAPGAVRRNMPEPIPVIVLGRLAVDRQWQGKGLGNALLRDALLRCRHIAEGLGVAAVVVHALSNSAADFYRKAGFMDSPTQPRTLVLPMSALLAG